MNGAEAGRNGGRIFENVVIYAVFASIWILFSDKLLGWLIKDPGTLILASTIKGWLFVAVTSLLLWWLLRRHATVTANLPRLQRGWLVLVVLVGILLAAGFGVAYLVTHAKNEEVAGMQNMAKLRAEQLEDWLAERRLDAKQVEAVSVHGVDYKKWRAGDEAAGRNLLGRLRQLLGPRGYSIVQLFGPDGEQLQGEGEKDEVMPPILRSALQSTIVDHAPRIVGPYSEDAGHFHLDFLVPLPVDAGDAPVVVLHSDFSLTFFDRWQRWPVETHSGEMILIKRDGDRIVFLNKTRFHHVGYAASLKDGRLMLKKLLDMGETKGAFAEGQSYRGTPVAGVIQRVNGTDWYVIAKMDQSEIYAEAAGEIVWVGMIAVLAAFMAVAILVISRNRRDLLIAETTQKAQREKLYALQILDAIASASDDAIFAKDMEGHYLFFNSATERFVGKTADEILGHDDRALFPLGQAQMLMEAEQRIRRTGIPESIEEHLDTPSGPRVFLATKGPMRDHEGKIIGTYGISRDITDLKRAEEVLSEQTKLLNEMSTAAHIGGWSYDVSADRFSWTQETARIFELQEDLAIDMTAALAYFCEQHRSKAQSAMLAAVENAIPYDIELEFRSASGHCKWIRIIGTPIVVDGRVRELSGSVQDIDQRKRTELALEESERISRMAQDGAHVGVWELDVASHSLYWSHEAARLYGAQPGGIRTLEDWLKHVVPEDLPLVQAGLEGVARHEPFEAEFRIQRDSGEVRWLVSRGSAHYDRDDKPVRLYGISLDVTERKHAELELKQRNDELERFNRVTIGRELDMVELKKRINELSIELGREPPYALAFLGNHDGGASS